MTPGSSTIDPPKRTLLAGLVFLTIIVAIQWSVGAYRVEPGVSDGTSDLMQGLLVRDYLADGLRQNPVAFAAEYQKSYPNLRAGTRPSLFHGGLGLLLVPHWPSHAAALFLLAAVVAWTTWRLYRIVTMVATPGTGFIVCLLFFSTPAVVGFTTGVTVDAVVAACAMEATYWLSVYMTSDRLRHAMLFGLFAGVCCLTTSSGFALMLMPLVTVVLSGRFHLLRRSGLYVATAIVVVVFAPALISASPLDPPVTLEYRLSRLVGDITHLWLQLGTVAMMLAAIGLIYAIRHGGRSADEPPAAIGLAMAALLVVSMSFSFFTGASTLNGTAALALPALFGLAPMGIRAASSFVAGPKRGQTLYTALLVIFAVTMFYARPQLAVQKPSGYQALTDYLQSRGAIAGKRVLIVSDPDGENMFVTDVAMRRLEPRPVIVRGSDVLSSPQAVMRKIEALDVDYVLLDSSDHSKEQPYWMLVNQVLTSPDKPVHLDYNNTVDRRHGPTRPLAVYRVNNAAPRPATAPKRDLTSVARLLR